MAKISKKSAVTIAKLYNSIYVGELMMKDYQDNPESWKNWRNHTIDAVNKLYNNFGIRVIGHYPEAYSE